MRIEKISENVGAEITDIDLRRPVDEATRKRLIDTLTDRVALVFRDQDLTPAQLVAAGRLFGDLMDQDQPELFCLPEEPLVRRVSNREKDKSGKVAASKPAWHTDHTNHLRPPKYTMLYPVELPSSGGGTSFCNMRAAYVTLPDDLRARVSGMRTVNVMSGSAVRDPNPLKVQGQKEKPSEAVIHPLVRTNPEDGSKALYFHPKKTENIVGMTPEASQDLLYDLLDRAVRSEFVYTHQWRKGDLAIWDNRSSLHKAGSDFDNSQHRLLYRLIVKGERPH